MKNKTKIIICIVGIYLMITGFMDGFTYKISLGEMDTFTREISIPYKIDYSNCSIFIIGLVLTGIGIFSKKDNKK